MQDLSNSDYYFIGAADDLGSGLIQYALYEPICGRFVLTSKYPEALQLLATLFSGRYALHVCRLNTATNFTKNLIDNDCCTHWSLLNKSSILSKRHIQEYTLNQIYPVTELVDTNDDLTDELVMKDREYLMAAHQWMTTNEQQQGPEGTDPFYRTEVDVAEYLDLPMPISETAQLMKSIRNIIFTEFDFVIAKVRIETILAGLS